jgi:hypothetical protein
MDELMKLGLFLDLVALAAILPSFYYMWKRRKK